MLRPCGRTYVVRRELGLGGGDEDPMQSHRLSPPTMMARGLLR